MKQVLTLVLAIQIAFISAVDIIKKSSAEDTTSITTLEGDGLAYTRWNSGQLYSRSKRSGKFVSTSQETINELKQTIREQEEKLEFLKKSNSAGDLDYKNQITVLQNEIRNLQTQLDNSNIDSTQKLNELSEQVQRLTSQVNDLTTRILPYDTIVDIENRRFEAAEEKMEAINNEKEIQRIIMRISRPGNFDLLNDLLKRLHNIRFKVLVFENVAQEIASTSDSDIHISQVIDLMKSLKSEILDKTGVDRDTKQKATSILDRLRDIVKRMAITLMKNALIDGNNSPNSNINAIYLGDRQIFVDSIRKTISDLYGTMDNKLILSFVGGFEHPGQLIEGYAAIFSEMKRRNQQNKPEMLDFADSVAKNLKNVDSQNVHYVENRKTLEALKNELPTSISALALSSDNVSIRNKHANQYLVADGSTSDKLSLRSYKVGSWKIKRNGENWKIRNNHNNGLVFFERCFWCMLPKTIQGNGNHLTEWKIVVVPEGLLIIHNDQDKMLCYPSDEVKVYWKTVTSNMFDLWNTCLWEIQS